jgi:hypothetical protein
MRLSQAASGEDAVAVNNLEAAESSRCRQKPEACAVSLSE